MQRDLVERAMAGDHDAFSALARASIGRLFSAARLILRDDGRAEDATQEALVAAWRDLSALRDPDRFEAWLHRLLVRACYREARRERRQWAIELEVKPSRRPCRTPPSIWPIVTKSSAVSTASTRISGSSSSCTTTSDCRSTRRRTRWASRPARFAPASIERRPRCGRRSKRMRAVHS